MKHSDDFKIITLATAISSILMSSGVQAATVGYSMMGVPYEDNNRLVDIPVNDATASWSSNPAHTNYLAPSEWRDGAGTLVNSPNYGWTQGGGLPATWYVDIGGDDSASLNSADFRTARQAGGYLGGVGADVTNPDNQDSPFLLQVGAGAFYDNGTNWGHNADFGLLHINETSDVAISISGTAPAATTATRFDDFGITSKGLRPGFAVWEGWDTTGGTRHTTWTKNGYTPGGAAFAGDATGASAVFPGAVSMKQNGFARGPDSLGAWIDAEWTYINGGTATLTLNNLAAGNYTLILGGVNHPGLNGTNGVALGGAQKEYSMVITSSSVAPVPVPAAAWLFGPALTGLVSFVRHKRVKPA